VRLIIHLAAQFGEFIGSWGTATGRPLAKGRRGTQPSAGLLVATRAASLCCWLLVSEDVTVMSSLRRGILARFSGTPSNTRNRPLPATVERFDLGLQDDDTSSIRTVLPPYSRNSHHTERPPSPAPTYATIDDPASPETAAETRTSQHEKGNMNPTPVINEFVVRLQDALKNPKSWRVQNNGDRVFFWALRCSPGTADVLNDHMTSIRNAAVKDSWKVEKFCVIFQGQKLGDLMCRPIQTQVANLPILHFDGRYTDPMLNL
jgi:hypothetical protein